MRILRWTVTGLVLLVASAVTGIGPRSAYACLGQHSEHCDYYQYHVIGGGGFGHPGDSYWSLDGSCDIDCDGNETCYGDTHIDSQTMIECSDTGRCPCGPPAP